MRFTYSSYVSIYVFTPPIIVYMYNAYWAVLWIMNTMNESNEGTDDSSVGLTQSEWNSTTNIFFFIFILDLGNDRILVELGWKGRGGIGLGWLVVKLGWKETIGVR